MAVAPAESRTKSWQRAVSAGTVIVIGAVALPTITLGALFLGYSVTTSLLLGLALSSPVTIAIAVLFWVFGAMFRSP